MQPFEKNGAYTCGYNAHSIGIAYQNGVDSEGKPKDTRALYHRNSLQLLVSSLLKDFPYSKMVGHCDLSPDLDGDGKISSVEWIKSGPCFDVTTALYPA